ncbi:hypothetical protein F5Y16DRAFT_184711 [Xylariaceae sp. FL0255]|nr:hypothetical protein F5Y16DRAFT_184711 [Xylariaceae sp. FL0255]
MPFPRAALWQRQSILTARSAGFFSPSLTTRNTQQTLPTRLFLRQTRGGRRRRFQSTNSSPNAPPPLPPNSNASQNATAQTTRLSKILSRAQRFLPKRLHSSLSGLKSAPVSHIAAFLVLHEITAILPLIGLTSLFYYMDWVPTSWVLGPWAAWAEEAVRKYVPWFRKRGLFGLKGKKGDDEGEGALEDELKEETRREKEREEKGGRRGWRAMFGRGKGEGKGDEIPPPEGLVEEDKKQNSTADKDKSGKASAVWSTVKKVVTVDHTEKGYKLGIQVAAAYTITKLLLIPRVALSLWMTPWLARSFVAFRRSVWKTKR